MSVLVVSQVLLLLFFFLAEKLEIIQNFRFFARRLASAFFYFYLFVWTSLPMVSDGWEISGLDWTGLD
jgi:hypothetical protein